MQYIKAFMSLINFLPKLIEGIKAIGELIRTFKSKKRSEKQENKEEKRNDLAEYLDKKEGKILDEKDLADLKKTLRGNPKEK